MSSDKEKLERLMQKVVTMREKQRAYFKSQSTNNKKVAIALETDVDNYIKQLERDGYTPAKAPTLNQSILFH